MARLWWTTKSPPSVRPHGETVVYYSVAAKISMQGCKAHVVVTLSPSLLLLLLFKKSMRFSVKGWGRGKDADSARLGEKQRIWQGKAGTEEKRLVVQGWERVIVTVR